MKKLFIISIVLLLAVSGFARNTGLVYHAVQVEDEVRKDVTTITSVQIYLPGTTTNPVIYADRAQLNAITLPMTSGSTNTTLSNGLFEWYGPDGYDFSITDGTNIQTNANHRTRTASESVIVFPTFLANLTTSAYLDADSITFGTGGDWVVNGGAVANTLQWTPVADNSAYNIGTSGTGLNSDFNVWVGTALGFKVDAGDPSLTWDGGVANINVNSNFATNVNTGTSTGAVNIGSSTAGAISVDTTSTATYNSDAQTSITTSDSLADIVIDSAGGRVVITSGEDAASAISLVANNGTSETIVVTNTQGTSESALNLDATAGGIDIDFATAKNMAIDGGQFIFTSNEDVASAFSVITNTGTSETITLVNTQGTAAGAIALTATAGGITQTASAGLIALNATGATAGDMTLTVGDDYALVLTAGDGTWQGSLLPATIVKQTLTTGAVTTADCGFRNQISADAQTITLPATATGSIYIFECIAADGGALLTIELDNADKFIGAGFTPVDGEAMTIPKTTQNKGDYIIVSAHTDGWIIVEMVGTWAEATP